MQLTQHPQHALDKFQISYGQSRYPDRSNICRWGSHLYCHSNKSKSRSFPHAMSYSGIESRRQSTMKAEDGVKVKTCFHPNILGMFSIILPILVSSSPASFSDSTTQKNCKSVTVLSQDLKSECPWQQRHDESDIPMCDPGVHGANQPA